jgi:hypothetical protein
MIEAVPVAVYPLPWEENEPDRQGSDASDATIMEREMVTAGVSVQFVQVFKAPNLPTFIAFSATPAIPHDTVVFAQAPERSVIPRPRAYQDQGVAYTDTDMSVPLAAPPLPLGGVINNGRQ